jgi:Flp pilus assembly protein TadD
VPETAVGAEVVGSAKPVDPKTDFHATATDRQRFQVHIDFGRVFESQGNMDAALLEYQEALTVVEGTRHGPFRPADAALAHRRMGGTLDRLGRFAQAEVHYKKALKLSPRDPKVWNDAGYSYYLQGRWADAERALKTAAKLAPADERARVNLGLTLAAAGKTEQALPLLSQSSGDAVGHANLGYLLAATGQPDLARRQYEKALAMRPDLDLARRALAQLDRQGRGQNEPAASPALLAQKPRGAGAAPALPAQAPESTHAARALAAGGPQGALPRLDLDVNQSSAARQTIQPPSSRVALPALEAPADALPTPGARTAPPKRLDLSELPPPPPL